MDDSTGRIVVLLENLWDEIHARHPELTTPDVQITVGVDGVTNRQDAVDMMVCPDVFNRETPKIFLSLAGIYDGSDRDIIINLLHAATHIACRLRGIKEVSKNHYYHNARFANMASEFGLIATLKTYNKGYRSLELDPKEEDYEALQELSEYLEAVMSRNNHFVDVIARDRWLR